ncbi:MULTISPECIES: aminotransferase class III-fold pyridoxal phosphate-dependent enzyme [Rhizobium/Agrobacterium group]|uniref:Aminotransferase class III-fold pyridoxal phosphate-dependent enzyme n=1 Tax=Rhizobium rhizogenes TaxID=359 RepID=A0A546X3C4_RHIRH|nr:MULTISPECIES: aminotransferase class III-fold pyridoxal phosphate-dependent enzyme [Rhizobium/Agrobacterium group]TRA95263.1 aminotransferase class III-fold pyridoxal phosphate-dependent enzyme [Rhizobium rhizogenes]
MTNEQHILEASSSSLWHPMQRPSDLKSNPPMMIVEADGIHVVDNCGRRYLDATAGGLSNVTLGYSASSIKQAMAKQLDKLPYYSAFRGHTNEPAEKLSHQLTEEWFKSENMRRVFLTSGGSDSVDTAMRLARQFWKIQGSGDRYKFLAMRNGYHGTHFGGASLNGRSAVRRPYEPLLQGCFHIPVPSTFRNTFDEQDPEKLVRLCISVLEEEINFQGADTIAALFAEPISGAGGLVVPPASFWPELRRVCDKYDILLIADEVITGFGRTGEDSGSRVWNVKPDMMCVAKAITSGYFPLGATLLNERVASAFETNESVKSLIGHGYTNSGHPVGCAAAIATLDLYRSLGTTAMAKARGDMLLKSLIEMMDRFPKIGQASGKGLHLCLDIVDQPNTNVAASMEQMTKISLAAEAVGLLVRINGSQVLITPPLIVTEAQTVEIADLLRLALDKAFHVE